jgi:hypothetical protein
MPTIPRVGPGFKLTENQASKVTDNYNAYAERMGFY